MTYDLPRHGPWARHFGGSTPKAPPPPPPPPQETDADIQAARDKERRVTRGKKGRGTTILAGEASTNFLQPTTDEGKRTLG